MRAATKAILDNLQQATLLRQCGERTDDRVKMAKDRSDALRQIDRSWSSFQLMLNNRRYTTLAKISYERFQGWNAAAAELKPVVEEMCARALSDLSWSTTEKVEFSHSITWDLATSLLEVEFSDIMPPLFNVAHVLPVYEAGHVPCGWSGPKIDEVWAGVSDARVPEGQVVVF